MVASEQAYLPYFRGHTRQRGRGFGALAQTLGRTALPFLRKFVVPAAKRIGADLLEIAAPDIGDVLTGKKNIKNFAKDVGQKTVRKQLGGGSKKKRVISKTKRTKNSRSRIDIFSKLQ